MRALQEQQRQLQADLDTHAALKLSAEQAEQVQLSHAFSPSDRKTCGVKPRSAGQTSRKHI